MQLTQKQLKTTRWTARIIALAVIIFSLPFYFGYGNPLPFANPAYTLLENLWLTVFPLMLIGLFLGWKYEKLGGYIVVVPITLGLVTGLVIEGEIFSFMFIPLIAGILYLIAGYSNNKKPSEPQH